MATIMARRPGSKVKSEVGRQPSTTTKFGEDSIQILSASDARALAARAAQGDRAAREQLILANISLAVRVAAQYECAGMTSEDLVQEAICGLIKAVDRFDAGNYANRFSTYAVHWIRQSVRAAMVRNSSLIRVPDYLFQLQNRLQNLVGRLRSEEYERPGTNAADSSELAARLGISERRMRLLNRSRLEQLLPQVDDSGEEFSIDEMIPDTSTSDSLQERIDRIEELRRAVDRLPPLQAWVIRYRFGLTGAEPAVAVNDAESGKRAPMARGDRHELLDAIARALNISRARVQRIERTALLRLTEILKGDAEAQHQEQALNPDRTEDSQ